MKFKINKQDKQFNIPKLEPKKKTHKWLLTKIALLIFLLILAIYGVTSFIDAHDFRSPIIFQNPIPLKERYLLNPVASASAQMLEPVVIPNPYDDKSPKGVAWRINLDMFGAEHWGSLEELVRRESNWNPYSVNSSSGACGLGQAYPCSKMKCEKWDYECQVKWTLDYIQNRYDNPTKALDFHDLKGWY